MRQRLYRGPTYERRKVWIEIANLVAMALQIVSEQRVVLPIEGFCFFKFTNAGNSLCKHAMQLRIDPMRFNRRRDELADSLLWRKIML